MQIKTTVRSDLLLLNPLLPKQTNQRKITSEGRDVENREALCAIGRNVNWRSHYGKQ